MSTPRVNHMHRRITRFGKYIVVTNHKCMYSTFNNANPTDHFPFNYNVNSFEKIFVYRHTPNRLISAFLNWGVKSLKDKTGNDNGLIMTFKNLKGFDMTEYYDHLRKNDIVSAFKMFLHALPYIKDNNSHLLSQYRILNSVGVNKLNTLINVNNKDDVDKLEKIIKRKLQHRNASDKDMKTKLTEFLKSDTRYLDLISNLYKDDAVFFKKYGIEINTIF